jgi:hypothetical protein
MSSNESAAYKIMTDLNVDYVLVNISLKFFNLSLTLRLSARVFQKACTVIFYDRNQCRVLTAISPLHPDPMFAGKGLRVIYETLLP